MESWRIVWRRGFGKVLSTAGLEALRDALKCDDKRLVQGATTTPPPLMCVEDWPCEGACPVGFAGWIGEKKQTVGEVGAYFGNACFAADQLLGEPAACRWFLNWYDDEPRTEMRLALLPEVELSIAERSPKAAPQAAYDPATDPAFQAYLDRIDHGR